MVLRPVVKALWKNLAGGRSLVYRDFLAVTALFSTESKISTFCILLIFQNKKKY